MLQELGREALRIPELSDKVTTSAIGGTWYSGKNHALTSRGLDFFEALSPAQGDPAFERLPAPLDLGVVWKVE